MSSSPIFDGPLGAEIANEIDKQVEGLSKSEAFAVLMRIIETESVVVDEANIRGCYAYQKISQAELWNTQYPSLEVWKRTRGIDDHIMLPKANTTLGRIKASAAIIQKNWDLPLETFTTKASKTLAACIAEFSEVCNDKDEAMRRMEACRRSRYLAEPEDRGRGVSSTEKLRPMDVKKAMDQYQKAMDQYRTNRSKRPSAIHQRAAQKKPRTTQSGLSDTSYRPNKLTMPSHHLRRSDSPEFARCHATPLGGEFSPELPRFLSEPRSRFSPQLEERQSIQPETLPADTDSDTLFQLRLPSVSDREITPAPAQPPVSLSTFIQPGKHAARYDQTIRDFDNQIQTMLKGQTASYTSTVSSCANRVTLAKAFQRDCHRRLAKVMKHHQSFHQPAIEAAEAAQTAEKRQNGYLLLENDLLGTRYGLATEDFITDTLKRLRLTIAENAEQLTEKRRVLESIIEQQHAVLIDFHDRFDQWEKAQKAEAIAATAAKASTSALQAWLQYVRESHTAYICE